MHMADNTQDHPPDPHPPWHEYFSEATGDLIGFVANCSKFDELKLAFEVATKTHYVGVRTSATLGHTDVNLKHRRLQWGDTFGNHPYMVLNRVLYECHHGPDRNVSKKEKKQNKSMHVADHDYGKKRMHLQRSKKVNCPATIVAKEIILFPDFQCSGVSKWRREQISKKIKEDLGKDETTIMCERRIFVKLPSIEDHKFHSQSMIEDPSIQVDTRIEESVKNEPYRNSLEADIREELDKIRNISYNAIPVNMLTVAKEELIRISNMLYRSVPNTNELPTLDPLSINFSFPNIKQALGDNCSTFVEVK